MKERLLNVLENIRPEIDFENESYFMTNGLFDSLDVVTILAGICEEFNLDIGPEELKRDNFETIENMLSMIKRYIQ